MSTPQHQQLIRELAYRIWEEQGRPAGREAEHWAEAERRLKPVEPPLITEATMPLPAPAPSESASLRAVAGQDNVQAAARQA